MTGLEAGEIEEIEFYNYGNQVVCQQCRKIFKTGEYLRAHMQTAHQE